MKLRQAKKIIKREGGLIKFEFLSIIAGIQFSQTKPKAKLRRAYTYYATPRDGREIYTKVIFNN